MRQLTFEIVQRLYEAIWPEMAITLASGTAIDESHISMNQTWEICDWAEGFGFDTQPLREKVVNHLATFDLEPPEKLVGSQLLTLHPEDGQVIVDKINRLYGWGVHFNPEQTNTLPAPIGVAMQQTSRNNGVIDICLGAMEDANMIPSDLIHQQKYREMLEAAFSQHLAILWSAEDVAQAMSMDGEYETDVGLVDVDLDFTNKVLEQVAKNHDCSIGINWDVLKSVGDWVNQLSTDIPIENDESEMRDEYDFTQSVPNPYIKKIEDNYVGQLRRSAIYSVGD
jgi:hypothetical protein